MINELSPLAALDPRVGRLIRLARQHAERLGHDEVTTGHLALALGRTVPGLVATGRRSPSHLPFAAGLEETITEAARQAKARGDERIGPEHLLLALGPEG
jgi:Clp amino terminal domain, pathogenicity island component